MPLLHSEEGLAFSNLITYPSMEFDQNKMTFLTGKSGCGKSTFLRMLNRTLLPSRGEIYYDGTPISRLPVLEYRRQVMLVPQQVFLFEGTVAQNFQRFYAMRGEKGPDRVEMGEFLQVCSIQLPLDTDCGVLSGGERQRVFLAIYLSCLPRVLLLDEPTAALDEKTARSLLANLKAFCGRRQITMVCVCHSSGLVEEFADEVIRLGEKR